MKWTGTLACVGRHCRSRCSPGQSGVCFKNRVVSKTVSLSCGSRVSFVLSQNNPRIVKAFCKPHEFRVLKLRHWSSTTMMQYHDDGGVHSHQRPELTRPCYHYASSERTCMPDRVNKGRATWWCHWHARWILDDSMPMCLSIQCRTHRMIGWLSIQCRTHMVMLSLCVRLKSVHAGRAIWWYRWPVHRTHKMIGWRW